MNTQIVPIERAEDGALIVSSLTIAEGAGVEHRAVLQLVTKYGSDLEQFGPSAFEMRSQDRGGHPVRTALLNEQQSTLVMTYMKNTEQVRHFKLALVKSFFDMACQLQQPAAPAELSRMQILQMALEAEQKNLALEARIKADEPKVDYVNSFVADNDVLLFRTVASNLFIGEMDLRWGLVYAGWIYHDQQRRRNSKNEYVTEHLWSEFSHKKPYFFRVMNHHAPLFKGNAMHSLKITPAGAAAIAAWVAKVIAEYGTFKAAITALEARYNERKAS